MKKSNGQIWIDKKPPYYLMYRAGNSNETATDRIIQSVTKYVTDNPEAIHTGQLVSINRSNGNIKVSEFPGDLDNILGIATGVESVGGKSYVSVATTGEVYILKDLVANARIIDESKLNTDEVQIMNKVKLKNCANGMVVEYTIVADSEANLKEKKIASSTPIAQGLLGHKLGETVEIRVPSGLMKFEILEIGF